MDLFNELPETEKKTFKELVRCGDPGAARKRLLELSEYEIQREVLDAGLSVTSLRAGKIKMISHALSQIVVKVPRW